MQLLKEWKTHHHNLGSSIYHKEEKTQPILPSLSGVSTLPSLKRISESMEFFSLLRFPASKEDEDEDEDEDMEKKMKRRRMMIKIKMKMRMSKQKVTKPLHLIRASVYHF